MLAAAGASVSPYRVASLRTELLRVLPYSSTWVLLLLKELVRFDGIVWWRSDYTTVEVLPSSGSTRLDALALTRKRGAHPRDCSLLHVCLCRSSLSASAHSL